jgi:hypothetical protein
MTTNAKKRWVKVQPSEIQLQFIKSTLQFYFTMMAKFSPVHILSTSIAAPEKPLSCRQTVIERKLEFEAEEQVYLQEISNVPPH